jgi:hypothetical protein
MFLKYIDEKIIETLETSTGAYNIHDNKKALRINNVVVELLKLKELYIEVFNEHEMDHYLVILKSKLSVWNVKAQLDISLKRSCHHSIDMTNLYKGLIRVYCVFITDISRHL